MMTLKTMNPTLPMVTAADDRALGVALPVDTPSPEHDVPSTQPSVPSADRAERSAEHQALGATDEVRRLVKWLRTKGQC